MFGYHGRYLRVDLSTGTSTWMPLPQDALRRFLGGVGLATYLMHRESPARLDALDPAAPLIFCLSPLVGTPLTTSAKFAVVAKSPLTNRLNDALSSSHFAIAAKRSGCDALVVRGRCAAPSLLLIDDGRVCIEPVPDLWGLTANETSMQLALRLGPRFETAVIGPAGENLVRYATISHDNRHAGRGGLGAVMGSKNLKAVAVAGSQRMEVADPAGVVAAAKDLSRRSFGPATAKYRELGTVANLLTFNRFAALPTRNFQQGTFEEAHALSGEELNAARRVARHSCAACTIGCEHIYAGPDGETRLEYESLFALGPLCGIGEPDVVLRAAKLCDQLGLDTISTGATIAFAMECAERGLLDEPQVRFGNGDILLSLIERIASRTDLGNLLAEGTRRAAETIGGNAADFAPHVKGMELPGYEPRALQTMALGFAVGSRGADHNRSGAYEVDFSARADRLHGSPEAALLAVETEDRAALMDSLILCKFLRGVFSDLYTEGADLLTRVTGWDVNADELRTTAQRIITAKKLYNLREGWTAAEDTLPERFLSQRLPAGTAGGAALHRERLQEMIQTYYRARGWDRDGRVPRETAEQLQLADLARSVAGFDAERQPVMKVGGIVLCGGQSKRMGRPKAWLPFAGETMLARVVRLLGEVVDPVVVVAAPDQEVPPIPAKVEIVRDEEKGRGPLQGLAAGLTALAGRVDAAYLSSCDVPFLQPAFVRRLIQLIGHYSICVPRVGTYHHPLAAIYRLEVEKAVTLLLKENRLRPFFLFAAVPTRIVEPTEVADVDPTFQSLRNLNTRRDYDSALRDAAAGLS
jgi:aldehyde:ferredoxin oxidoreductase